MNRYDEMIASIRDQEISDRLADRDIAEAIPIASAISDRHGRTANIE